MADGRAAGATARPDALGDLKAVWVWKSEGEHLSAELRAGGAGRWVPDGASTELAEGSALSDGEVKDGFVERRLHGFRFDLTTARPTGLPATAPVPVCPVRITDGVIEVALPVPTGPVPTGRCLR